MAVYEIAHRQLQQQHGRETLAVDLLLARSSDSNREETLWLLITLPL